MMKESFSSIADTRQQAQVRHDLYEIIAMTIAAVIGNSDGWDEVEDFCRSKEAWLREHRSHQGRFHLTPVINGSHVKPYPADFRRNCEEAMCRPKAYNDLWSALF